MYAGYETRWLSAERQWAIKNPGDLDELLTDVRAGKQSVSDALKLLRVYDNLRQLKFGDDSTQQQNQSRGKSNASAGIIPMGDGTELLPTTIKTKEGHDWTTGDPNTSTLLLYRGNELLNTFVENGRTKFVFSYDAGLREVISLFNKKVLRVDPHAWILAAYTMREAMRSAHGR